MRYHAAVVLIVIGIFFLASGSSARAQQDQSFGPLVAGVIDDVIAPGYRTLSTRALELAETLEGVCFNPTPEALDAAHTGYHRVTDAWMAVQWLPTALAGDDSARARIQFWPDTRNHVSRHLSRVLTEQPTALLETGALRGTSAAIQGLPALERLLFGGDDSLRTRYPCDLARAISFNIAHQADDLMVAWASVAVEAQERTLATELYQAVYEHLDAISTHKLTRPLGESAEKARYRRTEAWRSERSIRNIRLNLEAVGRMVSTPVGDGFLDRLEVEGEGRLARAFTGTLEAALEDARGLEAPTQELLADPARRIDLLSFQGQVDALRDLWGSEIGAALDLLVGFNSLDGD